VLALDVSIRAHIIGLLEEIQARMGVSYLFIAHDLAAVAYISYQIAVMYLGKIVEIADDFATRRMHRRIMVSLSFGAGCTDFRGQGA
jgi:ABC-type oligopeptide transport system ATPase subunit